MGNDTYYQQKNYFKKHYFDSIAIIEDHGSVTIKIL
jgi:hypothetical protein